MSSTLPSPLPTPPAPRDTRAWLVTPALVFILALFIYPFAYGLVLSFQPMNGGGVWANYVTFFTDTSMWPTIIVTLKLAVPATLINVGVFGSAGVALTWWWDVNSVRAKILFTLSRSKIGPAAGPVTY